MTTTTTTAGRHNPTAIRSAQTARATWYPHAVEGIAKAFHTSRASIENGDQRPDAVRARRTLMATARHLGMTSAAIGALLNVDHSTVLYGLRATTKNADLVRANALARDLADAIHRQAAIR